MDFKGLIIQLLKFVRLLGWQFVTQIFVLFSCSNGFLVGLIPLIPFPQNVSRSPNSLVLNSPSHLFFTFRNLCSIISLFSLMSALIQENLPNFLDLICYLSNANNITILKYTSCPASCFDHFLLFSSVNRHLKRQKGCDILKCNDNTSRPNIRY